jgi:hypothetical protein
MVLLVKPIKTGEDVTALGELTPSDVAEIVGPLVVGSDSEFNSTGGIKLPTGTTAERPASPKVGSTRFNTELGFAETWNGAEWLQGSGPAGSNGADGADGKSAYEIAVANGFVGTEAEWLDSLQGDDGPTVVSADADNIAILGTDGFIYVPKGAGGGGGAAEVPIGTTAERPNPPVTGNLRFNTTLDRLEVFGNSFWQILKYDRESLAPNIGTATPTSNTTADVTYSPSANETIEAVSSYKGVSNPDGVVATKDGAGAGTLNFAGLRQNTRYTFTVCAVNPVGDGAYSVPSNEILTFSVPDAPIIGSATTVGSTATVNFTAPAYNGGTPITSYTAVSTPDGLTGTVSQAGDGSVQVRGLRANTDYTFHVYATNIYGNGPDSAESNSVRPTIIASILVVGGGGGAATARQNSTCGGAGGGGVAYSTGIFFDAGTYEAVVAAGGGWESAGGSSSMIGGPVSMSATGGSGIGAGSVDGTTAGVGSGGQQNFGGHGGGGRGDANGGNAWRYGAGGGGGSNGAGGRGASYTSPGGNGGTGVQFTEFGGYGYNDCFFGGGGGGGMFFGAASAAGGGGGQGGLGGGTGGGNDGQPQSVINGTGGGGGGYSSGEYGGQAGGQLGASGIVLIAYKSEGALASGGTITQAGEYVIHAFTSSGTLTV